MGQPPKPLPAEATISSTMIEQHHLIERLLGRLTQAVLHMTAPEDRAASRRLLLRLRKNLYAHMDLEDGLLFREFESQSGLLEEGPTATLRREHEVLRGRLDELLAEWKTASVSALSRHLAAFFALYTDHCRREDVMYGICERLLSPEQSAKAKFLLQSRGSSAPTDSKRKPS